MMYIMVTVPVGALYTSNFSVDPVKLHRTSEVSTVCNTWIFIPWKSFRGNAGGISPGGLMKNVPG